MTSSTTEPSDDSENDPVGEKTQRQDVQNAPFLLSQSLAVRIDGNTVTGVQLVRNYLVKGTTSGTDRRIIDENQERKGQLYCEECDIPCGFTEQPAIELYQGMYLCPYCITDIIRATKKSLKALRDKIHDT